MSELERFFSKQRKASRKIMRRLDKAKKVGDIKELRTALDDLFLLFHERENFTRKLSELVKDYLNGQGSQDQDFDTMRCFYDYLVDQANTSALYKGQCSAEARRYSYQNRECVL